MIANSTVNLREGELLVLHCNTTTDIYQYLQLAGCTSPPGLPGPAPNTTGYCAIPGNYTSIVVYGFLKNSSTGNSVNLLVFDVEIHNLEQCLALVDAQETPSPCTTPPPIDDPATNASTTSNISITETPTSADTIDNRDPTETTAPNINDPGKIQQNNTKSEEIKDYTLYTAVCALGVIALVELMVIVLLAEKLCHRECCGKRRKIALEEGHGEVRPEEQREMSRHSSTSDQDEVPVIINRGSMDVSRERVEEGGATSTDQQQELEVMGKTSQLTSDKDKVVIANEASVDVESTTNASKVVVAEVAKREEEKEVVGEHSQQNSDTAKETVIANGGTCTMEAKERERTHGSSTDSINLTHATTNL